MSVYVKAVLFMLTIGCVGALAGLFPVVSRLEESVGLNMLFVLRGSSTPPADLLLVSLGRETTRQLNLPGEINKWPRRMHARIVDRLRQAGARAIVFDLLFNEPQSETDDRMFAEAIQKAQNVILAQAIIKENMTITHDQSDQKHVLNIEKVLAPITRLAESSIAQAPFPLPKIPIALHQFWIYKPSAGDIPTLPVVAFFAHAREAYADFIKILVALQPKELPDVPFLESREYTLDQVLQSMETLRSFFERSPGLAGRMLDRLDTIDTALLSKRKRELIKSIIHQCRTTPSRYLNFYGPPGTIRTIPYHRLLNADGDTLKQWAINGAIVFIGLTDSYWPQAKDGLYTVFSQPSGVDLSGVEIAATAFANLLERKLVTPLDHNMRLLLLMIWGAFVALICVRMSTIVSAVVIAAASCLYLYTAHMRFSASGLWLPVVVPVFIQSPLAYFSALVVNHLKVSKERQNIRDAFGYYLPNAVVDQLMRNASTLHDGGQTLFSTCLITDAARYTHVSETMAPESLRDLMNAYYEAVFKPIKARGGIILQVIGDSVLSIWTSPRPDSQQKMQACEAALGIVESVSRFNAQAGENQLPTRIGLHAGLILLGNIGAMDHFEYRPVGDIVNTASRLEGLNKHIGTQILVSKEVLDGVDGLLTRCIGRFVFIGKSNPNTVYELIGLKECADTSQLKAFRRFAEGLKAFGNRSWAAAADAFAQVAEIIGPDGPSTFYTNLCATYRQKPPDAGWDGTVNLTQK